MNFYNNMHPYYCGIDLHARTLYVCIIDQDGNICVHKEISANPNKLQQLLEPYIGNIVVGVECMHCWYWVSDFCQELGVDFILGHALYMKAIHGGKAKNDRIDSFKIANLIRGGNFPLTYVYPKEMRVTWTPMLIIVMSICFSFFNANISYDGVSALVYPEYGKLVFTNDIYGELAMVGIEL